MPRLVYRYREYLCKLSEDEREQASTLTLDSEGIEGIMLDQLKNNGPSVKHVFLAAIGDTLVGWGYLYYSWGGETEIHTYVKPSYRRRGIGSNIVKRLTPLYKDAPIVGHGWNDQATGFYRCFKRVQVV